MDDPPQLVNDVLLRPLAPATVVSLDPEPVLVYDPFAVSDFSSDSGTMQVLVGHLNGRVRARAIRELESRFTVYEAALPGLLRKSARERRPDVVVCPPGWLGDEDRRELRRYGMRVVEVDAETVEIEALLAMVNSAASRDLKERRSTGTTNAGIRLSNLMTPRPGGSAILTPKVPSAPAPLTRLSELSGSISIKSGSTPLPTPQSSSEESKPQTEVTQRGRAPGRAKGKQEAGKKKKVNPAVAKKRLMMIVVGLAVVLLAIVIWQITTL